MPVTEREAVACLKIVVAMAKADGKLEEAEKRALEEAIKDLKIAGVPNVENLLEEQVNLDAEVSVLASRDARMLAYESACSMAMADGECSQEEQRLLDRLKKDLKISDRNASILTRVINEARDTVLPSNIQPISDPEKRAKEIKEDVLKYSVLSAVLGAFPVPGLAVVTDMAVVGLQVKMVRDVGQYYGHKVDKAAAKSLLGALGLGTGARIAVSNLCKFVPVWGSAVGAAASFASTWALGRIADRYFAGGAKEDPAKLREEFKKAEQEGKSVYEQNKALVEEKRKAARTKIEALNKDLKAGKITPEEYEKKIAELS
ncbi:MAG: TerB family tellurite resistance protein [Planctomycetota bacterium]|nr:TerB family tellurite resistance protein [Planctomycetota bacterium]